MGSYGQWSRTRQCRRVTWVCGSEPVLVADVVREFLSQAPEHLTLDAAEDAESEIWAAAGQPLADPAAVQVVVVRNAQQLREPGQLGPLLAARDLEGVRVLFVSGERKLTHARGEDGKSALAPHLAQLRDSRAGQIVECTPAEDWQDTPDWMLEWASAQLGGAGRALGDFLLVACGGNLSEAASVGAKLTGAGLAVSRDSISALADPSAVFADDLVAGRRRQAFTAIAGTDPGEVGPIIGMLMSRLDILAVLRLAADRGLNGYETATQLGVKPFLQRKYKIAARAYTASRVANCRMVLAVADAAWRSGVSEGVLELIAASWGG
jgi:hypothetical protein